MDWFQTSNLPQGNTPGNTVLTEALPQGNTEFSCSSATYFTGKCSQASRLMQSTAFIPTAPSPMQCLNLTTPTKITRGRIGGGESVPSRAASGGGST